MGFCVEFGPRITEDCGHPMVAGSNSCSCPECGAVCEGQFEGCSEVWVGPIAPPPSPDPFEPASAAEPVTAEAPPALGQDNVLSLLHSSLVELTEEFRTVVNTVTEQGAETRALLEAQTTATGMLVEAIRMLPRQLEAAREPVVPPGEEDEGPRIREPIELLRPEVVHFDEETDEVGSDTWATPRGRHRA